VLQRRVVDQPAAGHVEDAYAVAHLRERALVEQSFGIGRLGQMDSDEVRVRVQLLAARGLLHAQLAVALSAHERVEGQHAHAEPPRAVRDELPDAAEPQDAERLLVQLHA
jgi:hypothetical protein